MAERLSSCRIQFLSVCGGIDKDSRERSSVAFCLFLDEASFVKKDLWQKTEIELPNWFIAIKSVETHIFREMQNRLLCRIITEQEQAKGHSR